MKKILILNSCISGGGAGRSLENYLRYKDSRIEFHMVVPETGTMGEIFSNYTKLWFVPQFVERIQRSRYRLPKFLDFRWIHILINCFDLLVAMKKITQLAHEIRPDVIYCNHMLANPVGAYVGWRLNCTTVYHARNIHECGFGKWFYGRLAKLKFVKQIICNSLASAKLFLKIVPAKVTIVHNFLDLSLYNVDQVEKKMRKEFKIPTNAFVCGFSGRFLPRKGIPVLLKAFQKVLENYPDTYLVMVGDNDGGEHVNWKLMYENMANDLGISDRVFFTGFQKDVRPYISDFDILAVPTLSDESFGRVLIEAMALKVPCVASNLDGMIEVVEDGKTGFLIPPNDWEKLAEKISILINQPELKKKFAETGLQRVNEKFSAEKLSNRISQALLDC